MKKSRWITTTGAILAILMILGITSCGGKKKKGPKKEAQSPVLMATPTDNAVDVSINSSVAVEFSRPMDPSSITSLSFLLADKNGKSVLGRVSYNGNRAYFCPFPARTDSQYKSDP
jgi:hypothetical protein